MAATRKKKVTDEVVLEQPTRDDIKAAVMWIAEHTNRVPTLWGPTASGKTWLADIIAKDKGAELITVLLAQHTPDEIAGFQTIGKDDGKLRVSKPYWFVKAEETIAKGQPVVILFDELGLARDEVRGALYTFMRDRHLHGFTLEGDVMIMAATNPAVLAPPYRSRCCLIPVPAERQYMIDMATTRWAKQAAEMGQLTDDGDPAFSNNPPPQMDTIDASAIAALNGIGMEFWAMTEPARRLVVDSLVPQVVAEQLLNAATGYGDVSALLRSPVKLRKTIESLDIVDAVALGLSLLDGLGSVPAKVGARGLLEGLMQGLFADADKLHAYYEAPKSEQMLENLQAVGADNYGEIIDKKDLIRVKNGKFEGILVDLLEAQIDEDATEDES